MDTLVIFLLFILGSLLETGHSRFFGVNSFCKTRIFSPPTFGLYSELNYMLYTRKNPQDACDLQPTNEALKRCEFDPNIKTAVIVHGFTKQLMPESPIFDVKNKLLQVDNYNVVVFNWTAYTGTFSRENYNRASFNSFFVGKNLASWIQFLRDNGADSKNFHVIAHSLGTEVTHYAAMSIRNPLLEHITYLDAAAPNFRSLPKRLQPSYTDAYFVEAMHTNGASTIEKGYGYLRPIAKIDYYPNGGKNQPRCTNGTEFLNEDGSRSTVMDHDTYILCSHDTAYSYYLESFNKTCKFQGRICGSYKEFRSGVCSKAPECRMGFYSKRLPRLPPHSKCYLQTSSEAPYCLNKVN